MRRFGSALPPAFQPQVAGYVPLSAVVASAQTVFVANAPDHYAALDMKKGVFAEYAQVWNAARDVVPNASYPTRVPYFFIGRPAISDFN